MKDSKVLAEAKRVAKLYTEGLVKAGANIPEHLLEEGFELCFREGHLLGYEEGAKRPTPRGVIERMFR